MDHDQPDRADARPHPLSRRSRAEGPRRPRRPAPRSRRARRAARKPSSPTSGADDAPDDPPPRPRRGSCKPGSLPNPSLPEGTDTLPQIEHIVVLMMENHSYDDHFGMLQPRRRLQARRRRPAARRQPRTPTASCSRRSTCRRPASSTAHPEPGLEREPHRVRQRPQRRLREAAAARSRWATGTSTDIPFYYGLGADVPASPTAGSARCWRRPIRTAAS